MPIWMKLLFALLLSCWLAYMSLWPLAWLTILVRSLWFFVAHCRQYSLHSSHGWRDVSKDLGAVLVKDPILNELMTIRMFPGRAYLWGQYVLTACYDRYGTMRYLWRHCDVRVRYMRRKNYHKQQRAKGQK